MINLKKYYLKSALLAFLILDVFFVSCVSNEKLNDRCDLCGIVVDEKNMPIDEYVIYGKNGTYETSAITNSNGLFVLQNMPKGNCEIYGEKKGYCDLSEKYFFYDMSKILCCQINSLPGAIDDVEKLIKQNEYKKANEIIDEVKFEHTTNEEIVVYSYKVYLDYKLREKEKMVIDLNYLKELDNQKISDFIEKMEELINGM